MYCVLYFIIHNTLYLCIIKYNYLLLASLFYYMPIFCTLSFKEINKMKHFFIACRCELYIHIGDWIVYTYRWLNCIYILVIELYIHIGDWTVYTYWWLNCIYILVIELYMHIGDWIVYTYRWLNCIYILVIELYIHIGDWTVYTYWWLNCIYI